MVYFAPLAPLIEKSVPHELVDVFPKFDDVAALSIISSDELPEPPEDVTVTLTLPIFVSLYLQYIVVVPAATPVTVAEELVEVVVPFATVALLVSFDVHEIELALVTFDKVAVKFTVLPTATDGDAGEMVAEAQIIGKRPHLPTFGKHHRFL